MWGVPSQLAADLSWLHSTSRDPSAGYRGLLVEAVEALIMEVPKLEFQVQGGNSDP